MRWSIDQIVEVVSGRLTCELLGSASPGADSASLSAVGSAAGGSATIGASNPAVESDSKIVPSDTAVGSRVVNHVTQDSRDVRPGSLFVPLVRARDGHDFIPEAVRLGAVAYLTSAFASYVDGDAVAIHVEDTDKALIDLAIAARKRLRNVPVVAITGSVGKTSTKDFLAAVLGRTMRVHANIRSFNNEIGVPLTLLAAPGDVDVVVIEMGSRGVGHISRLCDIAQPDMGVITSVGVAHTSEFGSLGAVKLAKRELVESLPDVSVPHTESFAFLNANAPEVMDMAAHTKARVITYGCDVDADVMAQDVRVGDDLLPRFTLVAKRVFSCVAGKVDTGRAGVVDASKADTGEADPDTTEADTDIDKADVVLGAHGVHMVGNALAAAAVGIALGVSLEDVTSALVNPAVSPLRMDMVKIKNNLHIINDSYNANPLSMVAALRSLASMPCSHKIAVLGHMAELGSYSDAEHSKITDLACKLGTHIIAVKAPQYAVRHAQNAYAQSVTVVPDIARAVDAVVSLLSGMSSSGSVSGVARVSGVDCNAAVLVKGSRSARMERAVELLTTRLSN